MTRQRVALRGRLVGYDLFFMSTICLFFLYGSKVNIKIFISQQVNVSFAYFNFGQLKFNKTESRDQRLQCRVQRTEWRGTAWESRHPCLRPQESELIDFKPTELLLSAGASISERSGTTRNYFVFPVCLNGNSQGVASLSGRNLRKP